ncbi:MAG: enoyl-CoA hydratase/isomerase family protein [Gammaproteobacteria bacterium]
MTTFDTLKVSTPDAGILQITLHRPDKLNALNNALFGELEHILLNAKTDDHVKSILLTGEGKAFCAGADISRLAELDAQQGLLFAEHGQHVLYMLETLGKPSIAAVNGFAFGGGCELAMSATIRIASTAAKFGQPEVKLGVIPGYGGTQRLTRLVGKGRALDLCLTGRFIDAETALNWGLITGLTEPDQLIPTAINTLKTIMSMAPIAIKSVMQVIDTGFDLTLEDALHLEALHFALTCATRDKQEGVSAFLAKRAPEFTGE